MNLRKVLSPELISLGLNASTKQEAVEELVDLLMQGGRINDRDAALQAVLERESKMSTGIQHGVAIPHGKTGAVNDLVACVAVKPEGIDFDSLDGEPSTIFIMTLSPLNKTGPHVQFLAEISRLLKTVESRERILKVTSKQELLSVLLE